MNKISKKIVALATMAAFVLTLVPAAAFAAPGDAGYGQGEAYPEASGITASTTEVEVGDSLTATVKVQDITNTGTTDSLLEKGDSLLLWATPADDPDTFSTSVDFVTGNDDIAATLNNSNIYKFTPEPKNNDTFKITFNRAGEYTIYAAVGSASYAGDDVSDVTGSYTVLGLKLTVNVTATPISVSSFALTGEDGERVFLNEDNIVDELDLTDEAFDANGTDTYTVRGVARQADGSLAINQTITLTSGDAENLQFTDTESGTTEVETNNEGAFSFEFSMNDFRNVPIYIASGDVEYTVRIITETVNPYDIDTTEDGGYILAGTDSRWNWTNSWFSDAVQFTITDVAGNPVTGDVSNIEPAADYNSADHAKNLRVTQKADDSTLDASKLVLVPYGDVYTLMYLGDKDDAKTDLVPGTYTVRVALESGDYATATFYVAEYGTTQSLEIDLYGHEYMTNPSVTPSEEWTKLDGEVTLGQTVMAVGTYVDENGIKIPAYNAVFGFNGDAKRQDTHYANHFFATEEDIEANETLLGSTITVNGFDPKTGVGADEELVVVDSYYAKDLAFDPTEGPVNTDNEVTVSVVDADGDVANVEGEIYAYLVDQSNEDAKVTVTANKKFGHDVTNGKGSLTIYATEDTDVEVAVYVKAGTEIYVGNLEYTVGEGDIVAHHEVTMTIGASEYVVDKQLFTMDAAPYIDSNWRTMIPIRALAEAFDADVEWDENDRTVTIEYNEQTIVMTVGETAYTVNGEEATMDTEPVIQDSRTYVPIRFAAEAMGFEVTPLYNADGLTASVVFQS